MLRDLVEVSWQMMERIELWDVSIKVNLFDAGDILIVLELESERGVFHIGVKAVKVVDSLVRVLVGRIS